MLLTNGHLLAHSHRHFLKAHTLIPFDEAVLAEYLDIELIYPCLAVVHNAPYYLSPYAVPAVIGAHADTAHYCGDKSVGRHPSKPHQSVPVVGVDRVKALICLSDILIGVAVEIIPFQSLVQLHSVSRAFHLRQIFNFHLPGHPLEAAECKTTILSYLLL